jgi:uroporphyrin-3 C-methyltransferase
MNDLKPASNQERTPAEQAPDVDAVRQRPAVAPPTLVTVLALIALGISIGLVVTAFFNWSQLQQLNNGQSDLRTQLGDTVRPLQESVQQVSTQVKLNRQELDRQLQRLSEEQESIGHRVSKVASRLGRSEQGWSLAEVEYLLRVANHRLLLQRDVKTAKQAMRSADARLRELGEPRYLGVREQIAAELESLDAVRSVDREGIYAGLHAWLGRIDALPVAGSKYQPPELSSTPRERDGAASDWKELVALVWESIAGLFRVRQHEQPVKAMLPPEREYFLRENLRLQLVAARLALLRDDPEQYRGALDTAAAWVAAHFASEHADTEALLAQLQEFAAIDIKPQLPDISASLRLLREEMKHGSQDAVAETPPVASPSPPEPQEAAGASAP